MTSAFPKLLTAVAAAAFLSISPVTAQEAGEAEGGGPTELSLSEVEERTITETFRTLTLPPAVTVAIDPTPGTVVPPTVELHPVPDVIVEVTPDMTGYHYYTLADGRIVFVHPDDRTIVMVLD